VTSPGLADARVRRALLLAIDRPAIAAKLFNSRAAIADGFVPPSDPVHVAADPVPFDPAEARRLLDAAGWAPGPDGIRRDAAGHRLSVELAAGTGIKVRELEEQVIQSQWKAVGVEATIRNEPPRTLFGETLKRRQFNGGAMFSWINSISTPPRQVLGTGSIPSAADGWGGSNYGGFSDPAFDADIAMAEAQVDPARAAPAWADMQQRFRDALPILPLFFQPEASVLPLWLHGYAPTGQSDPPTLWAERWTAD
jgi:peptide/nickel transport system substrate-binding protein